MTALKTLRFAVPMLAGLLSLAGCEILEPEEPIRGSGVIVEENRNVQGASAVVLAAPGTLTIVQGNREQLVVEAEDNLIRHVRTRVDGRTLRIDVEPGRSLQATRPIRYRLMVQDLERLTLSGSGSAEASDLDVYSLTAILSGSGGLRLDRFRADALTVTISGSGRATAAGWVNTQSATLSASGQYDARSLESRIADVIVSGSGSATVRVRDRLNATVSGSGSINYYGNPQVQRSVSGSGTVRRLGS
jgi:hypothetical protein